VDDLQEIANIPKDIVIEKPDDVKPRKKITDIEIVLPSEEGKTSWFRKNWKYLLGIVVTIALMTYLIIRSKPGAIGESLQKANYWFIFAAFGGTIVLFIIKTLRWMYILKQQGEKVPFMEALSLILIGTFGSAITPAKVGDILRAFYLTKKRKSISTGAAVFSVVFDRILDLAGIVVVVAISFPFIIAKMVSIDWWIPASVGGGIIIFLLLLVFVYNEKATKPVVNIILKFISKTFRKQEAKDKINITTQEIIDDFYVSQKNYKFKHYFWLGLLSILFWGLLGLQGYLFLRAFDPTLIINPLMVIMTLCVAAIVALTIPISISGIGIRDTIIVIFLAFLADVNNATSLSLSITQTFLNVLIPGIIGGLLIFFLMKRQKKDKMNTTKLAVG